MSTLNRRNLIKLGAGAVTGLAAGLAGQARAALPPLPGQARPRRALRLVHMTDSHVQPELHAAHWLEAALEHMQGLADPPTLILNTGDTIMDAFYNTRERTRTQWDLWRRVTRESCGVPIRNCIGNHDIWGWNKEKAGATGDEPDYGKKWSVDAMEMEYRFYGFDAGGWRFLMLDSVQPRGETDYQAYLDGEQWDWLRAELNATPAETPVLLCSHIPILAAGAFMWPDRADSGDWIVPAGNMHIDMFKIRDLLLEHPNVRLCLSGHLHVIDRVEYNNVTYCCDGALCGRWWKGIHQQTPPGYAVYTLYTDGTFDREYVTYGWEELG